MHQGDYGEAHPQLDFSCSPLGSICPSCAAVVRTTERVVFQSFCQFHAGRRREQTGAAAICIFISCFIAVEKCPITPITDGSKHLSVSSIVFHSVSGSINDNRRLTGMCGCSHLVTTVLQFRFLLPGSAVAGSL